MGDGQIGTHRPRVFSALRSFTSGRVLNPRNFGPSIPFISSCLRGRLFLSRLPDGYQLYRPLVRRQIWQDSCWITEG